ncbi:MAG: hypothetical protein ACK4TL_17220 [Hyphomicrobiaceae bacterium]
MSARILSIAAALLLMTGPAWSLTIANQDASEREVTVMHAGSEFKLKIGEGETMTLEQDKCGQGCSVTGTSGAEVTAQLGDSLAIKDGEVIKQ